MKINSRFIWMVILFGVLQGCTPLQKTEEVCKTVWGSSTRALEKARDHALVKTYECPLKECFDAVLSLARKESVILLGEPYNQSASVPQETEVTEAEKRHSQSGFFEVFKKDPQNKYMVVMGISGSINTTEVGIFFSTYQPGVTKVEISSLSTNAKRKVAQDVFAQLDLKFKPAI